jgi:hypothetical protein
MRKRLIIEFAVFLLFSGCVAVAQQDSEGREPKPPTGDIDIGYRYTSTSGDSAQYERYRDLRDGVFSNATFSMETGKYLFNFHGQNAGYRDQSYESSLKSKRLNIQLFRNSTPLNYSYETSTPWVQSQPGVFTLSPTARAAVQSGKAVGIPGSVAAAQQTSIYQGLETPFRLQQLRDETGVKLKYMITKDFSLKGSFASSHKTGYQPFGMSFAFNNANELPLPLDNRTNDLSAGFDWVKPQAIFSASFDRSSFTNKFKQIEWDNPQRLTDFSNGKTVPNGPYDPSGYSNGNGPATGLMSTFPDNSVSTVSLKGQYKMPRRTVINATLQISDMSQNDVLTPWTTNSVILQPSVLAAFPGLASLPRSTAKAKVRSENALVTFSSHPFQIVEFTTRWRHNVHSNLTRPFDAVEYVRFDSVPEETGGISVGYSFVRDTLDETVTLHLLPHTALRLGYGYDNFNQTNRAFSDLRDDSFRITFDAMGNRHISFRVGYEYVRRTGSGFDQEAIIESNAQPGLRYYDDADRNRNRVSGVVTVSPIDKLDFTFSGYYNGDAYTGPGLEFGLLNNSNLSYNVGVDYALSRKVALGATIGRNDNSAFQKSRNANPAPDPTWTDPSRNWWLTNGEASRNIDAYINLAKIFRKVDFRFAYSFSDSNNSFIYGGPRILAMSAIVDANGVPTFLPLPNVTNQWNSLSAEVKYHLAGRYGVAFGIRHENLRIRDFSTLNMSGTEIPTNVYLGGLITGYGNRPYNGTTGTFRIFRSF